MNRTVLALAVLALCAAAHAQTTVSIGAAALGGDRARLGQYNELRGSGPIGLLGLESYFTEPTTGITTEIEGTHLLGSTRELGLRWKQPGDWKFTVQYGQQVRHDPNTLNTGLQGAGTNTPQVTLVSPGAGHNLDLQIKRTRIGLGLTKIVSPQVQLEFSAQAEDVEGARLFGRGMSCPSMIAPGCAPGTGTEAGWAVLMLPEPLNASHSQIEARVSYADAKLRLSAGYHGSFYVNGHASLNPSVPATLNGPLGSPLPLSSGLQALLNQPMALAPDNQAHQYDLTGNYSFSPRTHGNFRFSRTHNTQTDDFASAGFSGAPTGTTSLNARIKTTRAQLGLSSRPLPKLSLMGSVRYEDKNDLTPIALYNLEDTDTYTNRRLPQIRLRGKLQAHYQFNTTYRGGLGLDHEAIDRGVFTATSAVAGVSALRQKTREDGVFADLRRNLRDDLSGTVSVSRSRRGGSNWLKDNSTQGVTEVADPTALGPTAVFMPTLADRQRDKLKLSADWQPTEQLALQFTAEQGRDTFSAPTIYGAPATRMSLLGVDGSYALTDTWSLTGYLSVGRQALHQARPAGYVMAFDNETTTLGLGFTGKLLGKLEVGGSLSVLDDRSVYAQTLDAYASASDAALLAATGGLPDVTYRHTALKLFGKYPLDKSSSLRFEVAHLHSHLNDWAWGHNGVPFVYSDGSTVVQNPSQSASFVGITYVYRWP